MVPPQSNSRLGIINPGLILLGKMFWLSKWLLHLVSFPDPFPSSVLSPPMVDVGDGSPHTETRMGVSKRLGEWDKCMNYIHLISTNIHSYPVIPVINIHTMQGSFVHRRLCFGHGWKYVHMLVSDVCGGTALMASIEGLEGSERGFLPNRLSKVHYPLIIYIIYIYVWTKYYGRIYHVLYIMDIL